MPEASAPPAAPDPPRPPSAARGRRWRRRVLVLVVLLVAGRIALPYALRWGVERFGPSFVRGTISLDDVTLGVLGGRARLDGLALLGEATGPEPVLAFDRLELRWAWGSLLRGAPRVESLAIDGLRVRGRRDADGTIDLLELPVPPERPEPPAEPSDWSVEVLALRLVDAQAWWDDERLDPPRALHLVLPDPDLAGASASRRVGDPLAFAVERVVLAPVVRSRTPRHELAVSLSLVVENAHHAGSFPVRLGLEGEVGRLDAEATLGLDPLAADATLVLEALDLPAWLANLAPARADRLPSGLLDGQLEVAFRSGEPLALEGGLSLGRIALALEALDVEADGLDATLTSVSLPLDGDAPLDVDARLEARGLALGRPDGLDVRVEALELALEPLGLAAGDGPATAAGRLVLEGARLARDELAARASSLALALTDARVPRDGGEPLRLVGRLDADAVTLGRGGATSEVGTLALELAEVTGEPARRIEAAWSLELAGARHDEPAVSASAARLALREGALGLPLGDGAGPLRLAARASLEEGAVSAEGLEARLASVSAHLRELLGPPDAAPSLVLGEVTLERPAVTLTLAAPDEVAAEGDAGDERAAGGEDAADRGAGPTEGVPAPDDGESPTVVVDALDVIDGLLVVRDPAVLGEDERRLDGIEIRARALRWPGPALESGEVLVGGLGTTPLRVQGGAEGEGSRWTVVADHVALGPFSPYAARYSAYTIERGALSLDAVVDVGPDGFEAPLEVSLHRLDVAGGEGETVFTRTFGIPLQLAIELLEGPGGDIDLSVPVSSRGEGTEVGVLPVVTDALRSALLGALTSPLKLLGAIFSPGGGVETFAEPAIPFETGGTTLDEEATEAVERTVELLVGRDELAVTLLPRLAADDQIEETPGEDGAVERRVLTEAELAALASARLDAVRAWLESEHGIAAERIREQAWDGVLVSEPPSVALRVGLMR